MSWRSCSSSKDRQCYWQCTSDCSPLCDLLAITSHVIKAAADGWSWSWLKVGWSFTSHNQLLAKALPSASSSTQQIWLQSANCHCSAAAAVALHLPRTLQQRPAHSKWHSLSYRTHTHTLRQFGAMALVRGLRLSPWDRWRRRRSCSWSKVERGARTNWCPCAPKWLFSYFSCRSLSSSSSSL